ncbi:hypothetical protein HU200_000871 [Digitaria exilis]|uniref:Uncharacterized protein n=1 Tax=Digitaria exilis TaxID=1010633 RepID=A0A835FZ64_9POAL|nr:hypothetical protein HU200_000871 [Digitaria exilis]
MNQLTQSLAVEWAKGNVRVKCLDLEVALKAQTRRGGDGADLHGTHQRAGGGDRVAASLVSFLCVPAASYITTQVICADGCRRLGLCHSYLRTPRRQSN